MGCLFAFLDDVERISERPACKYFRRAAKPLKGEQVASFERRREHGAPKDSKWHDKKYLYELREDFALIQNEMLAQNGFSVRVDHRSLETQKREAEEHGDHFLAQVFKRMPESYIGIMSAHQDDALTEDVKRYRRNVQIRQHSLFQVDLQEKMADEFETKFFVRRAEYEGLALINSDVYKAVDEFDESMRNLNQAILSGLAKIKQLNKEFVSVSSAREKAQSEYLTDAERKLFWNYKSKLGERHNLVMLLRELQALNADKPKQHTAFQAIESGMKRKIIELDNSLFLMKPELRAIEEKLLRPYQQKNVELVTHGILQANSKILNELKQTSEELLQNVAAFRARMDIRETPKTTFTAKEVHDKLYQQYRSLKRQYEQATAHSYRLMFQVISPNQALDIAKNIFVQGGFKKLRSEQESYQKALAKYERDVSENRKREMFFKNANWTNRGVKLQEQYYLTKEKMRLKETERKLAQTKSRLDRESTRLETLCQTEEAQEKIALLAAGILRKNLKIAHEYEDAKKLVSALSQKLQETKKRFNAFDEGYRRLKQNRVYRVIQPESNSTKTSNLKENELVAIIADALLGEPYAVQLVARSSGNNLEMEKDLELMSELDKDEIGLVNERHEQMKIFFLAIMWRCRQKQEMPRNFSE